MTVISTPRTARIPHQCGFCLNWIRPGERYVSAVLTPHDNDVGNEGWWRLPYHGTTREDCPDYLDAVLDEEEP